MTTGLFYIDFLYRFAFNVLIVFYRLLGENFGLAIIVFTLVLKFLTLPFALKQIESAKKNKEFQKKYKEIQSKHKNAKNKDKMTKELAQLQSEYLPAQLGGCLPTILQILFFFQVYYVVLNGINVGAEAFNSANYSFIPPFSEGEVLNLNFLGINLGQSASGVGFGDFSQVWPYILLVLLVGLTQFFSGRITAGLRALPEKLNGGTKKKGKEKKGKKKKKTAEKQEQKDEIPEDLSMSDAMQQASSQMIYFLPLFTMFIALNFPSGVSLYWTVTNGFAIIQQLIIHKDKALEKINGLLSKFKK
jgi:YidC/Oxa1 family membrane protein insertase